MQYWEKCLYFIKNINAYLSEISENRTLNNLLDNIKNVDSQ